MTYPFPWAGRGIRGANAAALSEVICQSCDLTAQRYFNRRYFPPVEFYRLTDLNREVVENSAR